MRDKLKSPEYWTEKLTEIEELISEFTGLVEKLQIDRGEAFQGTINGFGFLALFYSQKVNVLYSMGSDCCEIKNAYLKYLHYFVKRIIDGSSYFEMVRLLSLAVLMGITKENDDMAKLLHYILEEPFEDRFVDILVKRIDGDWKRQTSYFMCKEIYEPLIKAYTESDCIVADVISDYIENDWYEIHKECEWYDSHKNSTYRGYWSFEAGAISKILSIDDEILKKHRYYPYDLVHYDGGTDHTQWYE